MLPGVVHDIKIQGGRTILNFPDRLYGMEQGRKLMKSDMKMMLSPFKLVLRIRR